MKFISYATLALALSLACGGSGGGSPSSSTNDGSSFNIRTGALTSTPSLSQGLLRTPIAAATVSPADIEVDFGIQSHGCQALFVGYSGISTPQEFHILTTVSGVLVGSNGVSETFSKDDPSILTPNALTGDAHWSGGGTPGVIMARFGTTKSTNLTITNSNPNAISTVDEVVLRFANQQEPLTDALGNTASLVTSPHMVYNGTMYSSDTVNLMTNSSVFTGCQYFFFIPASKIGINNSYLVAGDNTVTNPVTNAFEPGADIGNVNTWVATDPTTWIIQDPVTWLNTPGCSGLLNVVNTIVAADSTKTVSGLATYLQRYFLKYFKAGVIKFTPNGFSLGSKNFEIIALDDVTSGPMELAKKKCTINLLYDPSGAALDLTNGILNVSGNPPMKFVASVAKQGKSNSSLR